MELFSCHLFHEDHLHFILYPPSCAFVFFTPVWDWRGAVFILFSMLLNDFMQIQPIEHCIDLEHLF